VDGRRTAADPETVVHVELLKILVTTNSI
jgi:hypothetical protein